MCPHERRHATGATTGATCVPNHVVRLESFMSSIFFSPPSTPCWAHTDPQTVETTHPKGSGCSQWCRVGVATQYWRRALELTRGADSVCNGLSCGSSRLAARSPTSANKLRSIAISIVPQQLAANSSPCSIGSQHTLACTRARRARNGGTQSGRARRRWHSKSGGRHRTLILYRDIRVWHRCAVYPRKESVPLWYLLSSFSAKELFANFLLACLTHSHRHTQAGRHLFSPSLCDCAPRTVVEGARCCVHAHVGSSPPQPSMVRTIAGIGSLVSEESAASLFAFSNFRLGEVRGWR